MPRPGAEAAGEPPATWIGVGIAVAMLGVSVLACLGTGIVAANESESFAVEVSMATMPCAIAGVFPWIVALLVRRRGLPMAIGVPLGCGCLGYVAGAIALAGFYTLIWPSL
jgi:hypothetical protein